MVSLWVPVGLLGTPSIAKAHSRSVVSAFLKEIVSGILLIKALAAERQPGRLSRRRHDSSSNAL